MATEAEKVTASQGRNRIPMEWLQEFLTWTDDALLSLNEDQQAGSEVRLYAGWELDYRIAFGQLKTPAGVNLVPFELQTERREA